MSTFKDGATAHIRLPISNSAMEIRQTAFGLPIDNTRPKRSISPALKIFELTALDNYTRNTCLRQEICTRDPCKVRCRRKVGGYGCQRSGKDGLVQSGQREGHGKRASVGISNEAIRMVWFRTHMSMRMNLIPVSRWVRPASSEAVKTGALSLAGLGGPVSSGRLFSLSVTLSELYTSML